MFLMTVPWKAAGKVTTGDSCHYKKPTIMKMGMKNGELAVSNKQNTDVFAKHITKVYKNKKDCFADAAKFIQ